MDNSRKFDFFALAPHGTGAHALFRYLELNPRIFPIRSDDVAAAIANTYRGVVDASFGKYALTPWVFAGVMPLMQGQVDAGAITSVVKPTTFIQLVRDPIRMMVSLYNRLQKVAFGIGTRQTIEEVAEETLITGRFFATGCKFASHFQRWEILDTTDITGQNTAETLRRLFGILDVPVDDELYKHPALVTPQNDLVESFLRNARFEVELMGVPLHGQFQMPGSLDHTGINLPAGIASDLEMTLSYEHIVGIVDDLPADIQKILGISSLQMRVSGSTWLKFHPKIRALIVARNALAAIAKQSLLPNIFTMIREGASFQKITVSDLDPKLIDRIKAALAPDARELFRKRPDLRQRWDICGDI